MASKTKIVGYKIETWGDQVIIHDSEGEKIESSDINELIGFLNEPYTDEVYFCMKIFWDMDDALAPVFQKLGVPACRELASPSHTYKDLFYIPSKIFRIGDGKSMSFFYDLSQYFIDQPEPDTAEEIAGYGIEVLEAYRSMGHNPRKLTSPVAIYEEEVLKHAKIPTAANVPEEYSGIIDYALECTGRLWIQAYQIGHWGLGEIFEYDIKSAYPYIASQLYDLQYANYDYCDHIPSKVHYGFMKGDVTIYDHVKVSPIFYNLDGDKSQRTGTWPTTITLQDYKLIRKYQLGEFKIKDGYFITFTAPIKPYENILKRLFHQRGIGGIINTLAKRMSTGVYGKCLEHHDDGSFGFFYNPIYAAMINSLSNIRVAKFIYNKGLVDDLVHVGVDSVLATQYVPLPEAWRMGQWALTSISDTLVLSSGRVFHGDKKPQGLNYDAIMDLIKEHPRQSYYRAELRRRQTLAESIELNDLSGLGQYKDTTSSFDLNIIRSSLDRDFEGYPSTGQELLNKTFKSKPLKAKE